jgi:hypothetical protein
MGKRQSCAICGKLIETYPCNDEKGVFTYIKDTDETGTKKEVFNLCAYHALVVKMFIQDESRKKIKGDV